ncbi:MAG: threonine--tRNA ligase [Planctomycetota bacterium]|nr:MAG: threonine--tRNA ligase [Planctomycetota bacterium]
MLSIRLPDGNEKSYNADVTPRQIAESIGARLAQAAIAAVANGRIVDLDRPLVESSESTEGMIELKLLTPRDRESLDVLRHSTAHIMARAIMRLYPGVKLAFGPTTSSGFYYDVDIPGKQLSEEDFPAIEAEMAKVVSSAEPFERFTMPVDQAIPFCNSLEQGYKVEHITEELHKYDTLSFYRQGEFVDLCRGPHIPHAGKLGAFKLVSIAGAYWKGRTDRPMLQRVYGTAFFDKKELDAHLAHIEEAKKRDHRRLGKELGLFTISTLVGSGLILWMPKGAIVRGVLENFLKEELLKRGYQPVYTPHIGKVDLYRTSGHYPYYRESQFPTIKLLNDSAMTLVAGLEKGILDEESQKKLLAESRIEPGPYWSLDAPARIGYIEEHAVVEEYLLKPMNCPHHTQIFAAQPRSYRDLPVRLAEFGTVYRYEQSGELSGMTRVRGFTQDDAHLFCTPDQVRDEFRATMELTQFVLKSLGLNDYKLRLSKHDPSDPKYAGAAGDLWRQAEEDIRSVLLEMALPFEEAPGEAAFYGPKADFIVRDCLGRQWQLGTVQLDYVLPERFGLTYTGADNAPHRPVMIHRAPFGSMERFMGILIEHFAGAFPLWLAPEQVRVLPISEKFNEYALKIVAELRSSGLRAEVDLRAEKIGAKIRNAQIEKTPVMLVVGAKEAEDGTVSYRDRIDGDQGALPLPNAIARIKLESDSRAIRQTVVPLAPTSHADDHSTEDHSY